MEDGLPDIVKMEYSLLALQNMEDDPAWNCKDAGYPPGIIKDEVMPALMPACYRKDRGRPVWHCKRWPAE
jgi:hypothetical protein